MLFRSGGETEGLSIPGPLEEELVLSMEAEGYKPLLNYDPDPLPGLYPGDQGDPPGQYPSEIGCDYEFSVATEYESDVGPVHA